MSYIIAATDFSDAADNALDYACKLAQDCNLPVSFLHSFMIPVSFGDNPMPIMPVDEGKNLADERMSDLQKTYTLKYPGVDIRTQVAFGDLVDGLQEMIADKRPFMVVLGNNGDKDDLLWMGSNVVSAMRHVKVPVLGVPLGYQYKLLDRLCYACDFKNDDDVVLAENMLEIAQITQSNIHVLYVDKENNESSSSQQEKIKTGAFYKTIESAGPVYHFVETESIDEGISNFIRSNDIDWLIVVPHKHSFWDHLFKKSHTKSLIKNIDIPILALHEHSS